MKKGTKIIKTPIEVFDTRNYGFEYWKEYCEDEGIEYDERNIDWDYISNIMRDDYEIVLEEISHKFGFTDFIVSGYLGLWNGRPRINNRIFGSFRKALDACLSSADDVVISYDNWGIYVKAMHHDGTNCFTISPIKAKYSLSEEVVDRFNPTTHKRYIQRINCLWE
jgi:hypothetical protein